MHPAAIPQQKHMTTVCDHVTRLDDRGGAVRAVAQSGEAGR